MFMTRTKIAGLLYNQTEQESISEAFVPVVSEYCYLLFDDNQYNKPVLKYHRDLQWKIAVSDRWLYKGGGKKCKGNIFKSGQVTAQKSDH